MNAISQPIAALAGSIPSQPAAPAIEQQPAAAQPGYRLVPAAIGRRKETASVVLIECPSWCTEDHVENWNRYIEDVTHYSDMSSGVGVPTFLNEDVNQFCWWSRVEADPSSSDPRMRAAHVLVGDDSRDEARLTPEMADEMADELVAWAAHLRQQARIVRLANQGDSDPDMDEALRRVREGGAV
ncbi:hypothetical protein ACH49_01360 [Streptomyces leeuwenhoekii]|uniref:Secreted Protein n=1 Tax=Streptomyces leeuwenhoekii TaxID=1437453 RepID=A0ABR5I5L9_STRLW|nr:hypothetical protein [Streptomyces leeuwenhoekii]KMS81807.1 hypothetical protein ACH49_01360 [Streptomyces leeuwenhoekii]